MPKKDFKSNPAMNFISQSSIEAVDGKPERPAPAAAKAPEGYRLNPLYIEKKSKRVQLLIQPSLYSAAKEIADELGISLNDFIHRAISEATYSDYVKEQIKRDLEE